MTISTSHKTKKLNCREAAQGQGPALHSPVSKCPDEGPTHSIICLNGMAGQAMQGGGNAHVIKEGRCGGVPQHLQTVPCKALHELWVVEPLRAAHPCEVCRHLQHSNSMMTMGDKSNFAKTGVKIYSCQKRVLGQFLCCWVCELVTYPETKTLSKYMIQSSSQSVSLSYMVEREST